MMSKHILVSETCSPLSSIHLTWILRVPGLVVQSPKYKDTAVFVSMALSFDPVRNITSGFLGYVQPGVDENGGEDAPKDGMMDIVFNCLQSLEFSQLITHPILLPVLVLQATSDVTKGQLEDAREALEDIREKIKQSAKKFTDVEEDQRVETQYSYGNARSVITEKNFDFWGEVFWFNQQLAKNCSKGIQQIRNLIDKESKRKLDGQKKSSGKKRPKNRKKANAPRTDSKDAWDPSEQDTANAKRPWLAESGLKEYLSRLSQKVEAQGGRRERMVSHLRISFDDVSGVKFSLHCSANQSVELRHSISSAEDRRATYEPQ